MRNTLRLLRGLFALVALSAILGGIPVALWYLGSPLLPDRIPSFDEAAAALRRPDDGRFLLGFLVVSGWLFWLHLALSTLAEITALVRTGTRLRLDLRGFRTSRALMGLLIAWLMTMFGSPATASATLPAAVPVSASFVPEPASLLPNTAPAPDGPEYTVTHRDTLWDIAERALGDPLRWRQIFDLNAGRTQADGGRLEDGSLLRVGWVLRLPVDAAISPNGPYIRVEPGDTLTGLAAEYLHDPKRYPEIYEDNAGAPQDDGRSLQDADLIRPGWLLTLPATAAPAEPDAAPAREIPPAISPPPPPARQSATPQPPPSPSVATRQPTASTPTAPAAPTSSPGDAPASSAPVSSAPAVITVSGVAAAGLVAGLLLYRRRQLRLRPTGRQIALPDEVHSRIEGAAVSSAQINETRFLDLALRSVAAACAAQHDFPDLSATWLTTDGLDLVLDTPRSAPPPFTAEEQGSLWRVSADAVLPVGEDDCGTVANPFPALAAIGTGDDGTTLLLDLEHHGAVHLVGDRECARDLLRNMTVELATSRWADATEILLVGLEPQLADLPQNRLTHAPDLHTAASQLRAAINQTRRHLDRLDTNSVVDARVHDQLSETWVVTILVVADPPPADDTLLSNLCGELSRAGRVSAAVVTSGTLTALPGLPVHVETDGAVEVSTLGDERLRAEQMSADLALGLVSVIGTTLEPDVPVAAASDPHPWAVGMTIDGALAPDAPDDDLADTEDNETEGEPRIQDPEFTAVSQPSADPVGTDPTTGGRDPRREPDPVLERALLRTERSDPDLDADLALWWTDEPPTRPLITILGEPDMRAPGVRPTRRVPWLLEVALYLALHPHGVDRDKISTDLWLEGRNIQPPTIRRAMADVRAWAGQDTSTDPPADFIPSISSSGTDRYRMTGHLIDWDLFRRLRKRAQARAAAGHTTNAIADYQAALGLVRGPVLRPLRERGYAWLRNSDQHHESFIPGFIVDTAHELVELALADRDLELARYAAETARLVDPDLTFDRPFTDLMRIAHAEGNLAEMREHADMLLAERGFEVGEDLPPESFAVLNALFPNGLRAPVS